MKPFSFLSTTVCAGAALSLTSLQALAQENLLPKPAAYKISADKAPFVIKGALSISTGSKLAKNAANYLREVAGDSFKVTGGESGGLNYSLDKTLGAEAYTLQISSSGIEIKAADQAGFFYGTVSLLQLMPADIWSDKPSASKEITLKACSIQDKPRFAWRGMMLDCSRQFFDKEYVMKFIDRMAQHKLNTFHWHLTDDEGWRIEIKKYPKLTSIGARRGPGTQLPFNIIPAIHGPKDKLQEGFYTQEDIKEIVAYAEARSVTIVPEIDVPGHAKAAVVAYPHLLQDPKDESQYRSVQGTPNNCIDPGLESSYEFLDNVLKEVAELFPSKYIHIGGDEIPHGAWAKSPAVKALMKKEGLKDLSDVRSYFFQRLEKNLAKYDRELAGWEEVMHGKGLTDKDSVIFSWQNEKAGIEAAKKGIEVVMTPAHSVYYDLKYVSEPGEPGLTWAGVTDTKDSYRYNPMPKGLSEKEQSYIKGVHGCLWGETLVTPAVADYMAWPRMFALSEMAWTPQDQREWQDFSQRAFKHQVEKLNVQGVQFRVPKPSAKLSIDGELTITAPFDNAVIRYSTDGSELSTSSPTYSGPISLDVGADFKAAIDLGGRLGKAITTFSSPPLAAWKPADTPADFKAVDFDVSKRVKAAGSYTFEFIFKKGEHALGIKKVELVQAGKVLATDEHDAFVGGVLKNNTYSLDLASGTNFESAPIQLRVTMKGEGGTDSNGIVTSRFTPVRPKLATSTNIPAQPGHDVKLAADYKDGTWFFSSRAFQKDDHITVLWEKSQSAKKAFVVTGLPSGGDQIVNGVLEYTLDGNAWKKGAEIQYGNAEFDVPNNAAIKGLRLRVTESQETKVIVREINLK